MLTTCELCKYAYVSGLPEDEQKHDALHNDYLRPLIPKPSPLLRSAREKNPVVWVDRKSPEWMREEVYWRAKIFQREFGYDMAQWEIEGRHDPEAIGFLFHDPEDRIIGACAFRPIEKGHVRLDWIWLCPAARRTGVLSRHWEMFRDRFGVFLIGGPISGAMSGFLRAKFPDHIILPDLAHEAKLQVSKFI